MRYNEIITLILALLQLAYEDMEPSALVLLVHGIGETLWSRPHTQGPLGHVSSCRAACAKLRSLAAAGQADLLLVHLWSLTIEPRELREGGRGGGGGGKELETL